MPVGYGPEPHIGAKRQVRRKDSWQLESIRKFLPRFARKFMTLTAITLLHSQALFEAHISTVGCYCISHSSVPFTFHSYKSWHESGK